jgi:hypothetical protein
VEKNGVLLNVKSGGTYSLLSLFTQDKIFIVINIYQVSLNSGLTGKNTRQQSSIDVLPIKGTP